MRLFSVVVSLGMLFAFSEAFSGFYQRDVSMALSVIMGNSTIRHFVDEGILGNLRFRSGASDKCFLDLAEVKASKNVSGLYWQMSDASGKLPSRLLDNWAGYNASNPSETLAWFFGKSGTKPKEYGAFGMNGAFIQHMDGDFDECNRLGPEFQYCYNKIYGPAELKLEKTLLFTYGSCLPSSCMGEDVSLIVLEEFNAILSGIFGKPVNYSLPIESNCERTSKWTAWPVASMTIVSFFLSLVFIGSCISLYDIYFPPFVPNPAASFGGDDVNEKSGLINDSERVGSGGGKRIRKHGKGVDLLLCFSLIRNYPKLFNMERRKGGVGCFEGMRMISMMLIILGHNYVWFIKMLPVNEESFMRLFSRPSFNIVVAIPYAVDSFFYLSGFLVSWAAMNYAMKPRFPWVHYYVHRYIRLTPTYMFVMLIFVQLIKFFGSGPVFYTQQEVDPADGCTTATKTSCGCLSYWWANFLYIQNFYPTGGLDKECMGWTWYLANDMQFYIVTPLFLIAFAKSRLVGMIVWAAAFVASIITPIAIGYHYDIESNAAAGFPYSDAESRPGNLPEYIYNKPYCRIAPYLVGVLCGYIFWSATSDKSPHKGEVRLSKLQVALAYFSFLFIFIICVFGLGDGGRFITPDQTRTQNAVWLGFQRALWGIMLGIITLLCVFGYGGWMDLFLSHPIWMPGSKLTYCAYLCHPLVLNTFYVSLRQPVYYTDEIMVYYYIGNLIFSYIVAAIVSLTIEFPFASLEKKLL